MGAYSTNDLVYVIIDFTQQPDSQDFMYVLIRPLDYEINPNVDDDDNFGGDSPLYDMSNEPVQNPLGIIDYLIGLETSKKILTFGIEPEPPVKKPKFVDPNQLSLFETKEIFRKKLGKMIAKA